MFLLTAVNYMFLLIVNEVPRCEAQSNIRDARSGPRIDNYVKKWKTRPGSCYASNLCQNLREASELTTDAQRVASA